MKRVITIAMAGYLPCGAESVSLVRSYARACAKRGAAVVLFPACAYAAEAEEIAKQFGVSLVFGTYTAGEGYRAVAVCHPQGDAAWQANALADAVAGPWGEYSQGSPETAFYTAELEEAAV